MMIGGGGGEGEEKNKSLIRIESSQVMGLLESGCSENSKLMNPANEDTSPTLGGFRASTTAIGSKRIKDEFVISPKDSVRNEIFKDALNHIRTGASRTYKIGNQHSSQTMKEKNPP